MNTLILKSQQLMDTSVQSLSSVASLALRLYLVPVFWVVAGMNKVNSLDDIMAWFGNEQWGLDRKRLPNDT
ncbi:MAG: hypothetical protein L3J38_02360 [Thiomicrorhabdus sp.]|nr:hypothetical protein [Thiomicrorhabdus sp.]